jgi:hypothetical protein
LENTEEAVCVFVTKPGGIENKMLPCCYLFSLCFVIRSKSSFIFLIVRSGGKLPIWRSASFVAIFDTAGFEPMSPEFKYLG